MSVSVTRSEGTTVLTLTSDQSSACPPLCQLLGALCYSPRLCSLPRRATPQRGGPLTVLGALWIITGVLNTGLGTILYIYWSAPHSFRTTHCPMWLGVVFVFLGVACVLTERFPRPVLVLLNGILNLVGFGLSIAGIVLYSMVFDAPGLYIYCSRNYYYWGGVTTASAARSVLLERCEAAAHMVRALSIGVRVSVVTLSVLDLCLGLSAAIVSFRSLRVGDAHEEKTTAHLHHRHHHHHHHHHHHQEEE